MNKIIIVFSALLLLVPGAMACTNFPINIGAMDTLEGRILVESLSVLINERTGVTVGIHYFTDWEVMDKAVKDKRLEIILENTSEGLRQLEIEVSTSPDQNLARLEDLYKDKEMIWLKPFVFSTKDESGIVSLTAPVISRKSLSQFPALPRLIAKLTQKIDDQALQQLVQSVGGNAKPKHVARDFLKEQNLI